MSENNLKLLSPENKIDFVAPAGASLRQILNDLPDWKDHESLAVFNHGHQIKDIDGFIVNEGDSLVVCIMPEGGNGNGKAIGSIVAAIVIIAVAWYSPASWYTAGGLISQSSLYALGASMLLSGVGMLLAPKPSLGTGNFGNSERENTYTITGQSNQARPYQPVLVAYGRNKIYPVIAANPNVINVGKESTFDVLYDFGIGEQWFGLGNIKFGDTPASEYNPQYFLHTNTTNPSLILIANRYGYQDFQITLEKDVAFTATTKKDTTSAEVNITFPQGLYTVSNNGSVQVTSVDMRVEWRKKGSFNWNIVSEENFFGSEVTFKSVKSLAARIANEGEMIEQPEGTEIAFGADSRWAYKYVNPSGFIDCTTNQFGDPAPGSVKYCYLTQMLKTSDVTISGATTAPFVVIASVFFPEPSEYEIRITRLSSVSKDTRTANTAVFTLLESRVSGNVLNLTAPHTMLEMRVRASDRLNGIVQNLSVVSTSVLNIYDASGNVRGRAATRNPAWICVDIMIGKANPRPIRHEQIDWPAWKALADICDAKRTWNINGQSITTSRFYCDVVIDYETTIKELLENVLSTCRSSLVIGQNGRYSVTFDGNRNIPRQLITPSNSWGFSATRQFPPDVHALRVSFEDEQSDYKKQEILVYRDGYTFQNATKFEDVGTFGVKTFQHAWALGRYQMASAILRSEVFTITMDIENLACQRGDLVSVAHDVPMIGGQQAHIKSISGNTFTVTEDITDKEGGHIIHRASDGVIRQGILKRQIDANTFEVLSGVSTLVMSSGDLVVIGDADNVVESYIVAQISPNKDLTATLTLLPYSPDVYNADIGDLPEWNPEFSQDLINSTNLKIYTISATSQQLIAVGTETYGKFKIDWSPFPSNIAKTYDLLVEKADGSIDTITGITGTTYEYKVDLNDNPLIFGDVKFTVIPYTAGGLAGQSASALSQIKPVDLRVTSVVVGQQTITIENGQAFGEFLVSWSVNDNSLVRFDLSVLTADGKSITISDLGVTAYRYKVDLDDPTKIGEIAFTVVPYTAIGIKGVSGTSFSEVRPIDLSIAWLNVKSQEISYVERMPVGTFYVTWELNYPTLYSTFDLEITTADGVVQVIKNLTEKKYKANFDLTNKAIFGDAVFKVIPYSNRGLAGNTKSTQALIYREAIKPKAVNWFLVNVQDMNIALSWEPPQEPDIAEFEIRYSPNVDSAVWNTSQLVGVFNYNVTRTMVGARTGTYMICVRDTSGNLSDMFYKRTTIEKLPDINLIETINDYPTWSGTTSLAQVVGNKVQLTGDFGQVSPEGFYYYDNIFDAGQIYELRIVSKIQSHGITRDDFMVNWTPLASAIPISKAQSSQFSAMLEVRTADDADFMVNWQPLASAIPLVKAGYKGWSAWRPCEVGDFTGRLFQFRIRIQSFDENVRTVIDDGLVEIDVRDRIDRYSDLVVPKSGLTVNFAPAFMETPTLAITTENSKATSKKVFNKSRTAFTVQLFDEFGVAVDGQVDVLAMGYGREQQTSI